ncbi:MAG: hypothetical protein ACRDS0_09315 [Pseudonocardiaceae bacterium]
MPSGPLRKAEEDGQSEPADELKVDSVLPADPAAPLCAPSAYRRWARTAPVRGELVGSSDQVRDRMLVAQAQCDGLTLLTADPLLRQYDVPIEWAG